MLFHYREIEPGKFAPIIEVCLYGRSRMFRVEAFIDSGADFSVFDVGTATLIGLDYRKGTKLPLTVGDGGKMTAYRHLVTLAVNGSVLRAPVCFSPQLGAGFNLLGRAGFFDHFRICFHEKRRFVSLSPEPSAPRRP